MLNNNLNQTINEVTNRSKHPFPIIIEFMKLIGVGFILTLLLGVLNTKNL